MKNGISLESARNEKSRGLLMHPRLNSENYIDVLVYRIVPVPSCPRPRWERWTALADSEEQAHEVILYHFPGHISLVMP
jgi:hypothetical protein